MSLIEDFSAYFPDLGVDITTPGGTVRGIFDNGFMDAFGVAETEKVFVAASSGVLALAYGHTVTISGTTYTVAEVQPDGTGMTRVRLK